MNIRKTGIGIAISASVSVVMVIFLVLLWPSLGELVANMNVGFLMFLNTSFWNFVIFYMALSFAITLVISFAIKEKFKRRD